MNKDIFKAYDIRGIYPTDIDAHDVKNIAKAYTTWLKPQKIALGRDVRLSGKELWSAAAEGLTEMGVDIVDLGIISTDMLYFAVANYGFDGGITITASHNSGEYNGIKMIKAEAKPISMDSGIAEIRELAMKGEFESAANPGKIEQLDFLDDYVTKMVSFTSENSKLKIQNSKLKVVVNPNFGAAGIAIQKVADYYNLELTKLNFEPDGNFPKGKPDPTQSENRTETQELIQKGDFDFGAIWDADADRCFFYDEKGNYILPIYITGLLMEYFLRGSKDEAIVVDPRSIWLPKSITQEHGARLAINKSGHSYIKERMRQENAVFGAETSAHYYFRDAWFADNGLIPFVIMLEVISESSEPLSILISKFKEAFFAIEETNFKVKNVAETIDRVSNFYSEGAKDYTDGVSIEFDDWRMNLRGSNTEPVIRLNIEAKSQELASEKLDEISKLITE